MSIEPIASVTQVSSFIQLKPLMNAMETSNDQLPKNSLPVDSEGTIQSHTTSIPEVTLYNAHGIVRKNNPNSLIGHA